MRTICPDERVRRRQIIGAVLVALAGTLPLCAQESSKATAGSIARRVPLSGGQARAISLLRQVRPETPAPLFLFTDPNKDPDDLNVLVALKFLQQQGFVELRCLLATLGDRPTRLRRAQFAAGVLDDLGLESVRVGLGTDYDYEVKDAAGAVDAKATDGRKADHNVFLETPLLRPQAAVEPDGLALLKKELEQVPDHRAVLLINAGMADAAALLREAPELVKRKAAKVVIMGGVEPSVDARGFVVADKRAYNNTTHQASADFTYARVQELGVPLVVVTKDATYAAAAPRSFYDGLAATGHPVGVYLRDQQMRSLQKLWEGIRLGHLPAALTPEWFFKTFTDVDLDSTAGKAAVARANGQVFEEIWKQVSKFNLYDPLALLAATPGASELLFQPHLPAGCVTHVQVVGRDSIKDSTLIKDLLAGLAIESLNPPMPRKSRTDIAPGYPPRQQVDEIDAPWTKPLPGYAPAEYTAPAVFEHAWMETTVLHKHLTAEEQGTITLQAGDDARTVSWVDVDRPLLSSMYASHGEYVWLALAKLRHIPGLAEQIDQLLQ